MARLAGLYLNDTAAAPDWAVSVYISGCPFHCPGCHNPEAQDFDFGEEITNETFIKIRDALEANGVMRSLCLLGGEPLAPENRSIVNKLIAFCRLKYPNLPVYIWSGYTFEELKKISQTDSNLHAILNNTNYIIDGRFELDKRDITLKMRGSSNQHIWHHDIRLSKWERIT